MKKIVGILFILILVSGSQAQIKKSAELYGALRYSFNYIDEKDMGQIKGLQGHGNLSWLGINR